MRKPVKFESKAVRIIFCLGAIDNTTHLKALANMAELLSDDLNITRIKNTTSVEKIVNLIKTYDGEDKHLQKTESNK